MLVIRLFRVGKKNQPVFKIVVADKRNPTKAGRFVEEVGFWNPLTREKIIKGERVKYWLSVGAKPSATIHNLLVSEKIVAGKKIPKHSRSKKKEGEKTAAPAPVAPKPTEAKKAPDDKKPVVAEKPKETPADKK